MGGYDVYCVLCGGPPCMPYWEGRDGDDNGHGQDDSETEYDNNIIKVDDASWLNDVNIVGFNANSTALSKAYITSAAQYDDWAYFQVQPSDDPNVPEAYLVESADKGSFQMRAYEEDVTGSMCFPVHATCLHEIFPRILATTSPVDNSRLDKLTIEKDTLYSTFKALSAEPYVYHLDIDYGPVTDNLDQYWPTLRGEEWFAMNPHNVNGLDHLFSTLPSLTAAPIVSSNPAKDVSHTFGDPFGRLPPELNLKLLLTLPGADLNNLRAASRTIASLNLGNNFWKLRFNRDMPWFYGLDDRISPQQARTIDWKALYAEVNSQTTPKSENKIYGLANRRRIWRVCEIVAETYWKIHFERAAVAAAAPHLLGEVNSFGLPRVAFPLDDRIATSFIITAVNTWHEIASCPLIITTEWNRMGQLVGLQTTLQNGTQHPRIQRSPAPADVANTETVRISKQDWLVGVRVFMQEFGEKRMRSVTGLAFDLSSSPSIAVGSSDGAQRFLAINEGLYFVGFQGEVCDGVISRLALLQGKPAASQRADLIQYASRSSDMNQDLLKYLWTELPPRNLIPSPYTLGYWTYDFAHDITLMSALIIGVNEEDFKAVTAISGDTLLGGFAIHYSDRPVRSIGPRCHAMKRFPISGSDGERIVAMNVSTAQLVQQVNFLTNRGRQVCFGAGSGPGHGNDPNPAATQVMAGFFCSWAYGPGDKQLSSCALLSLPVLEAIQPTTPSTWISDGTSQRIWDGSAQPSTWQVDGPVFGNNLANLDIQTGGNHRITTDPQIVAWLDCSKPVQSVEVWYTHPLSATLGRFRRDTPIQRSRAADTQFVSVMLHLGDGISCTVGPSEFDERFKTPEADVPSCTCDLYWKDDKGEKKPLPFSEHYHGEEFQAGGQRLAALRVWASVYLDGLQVVFEDGRESQVFGRGEGEPDGVIHFGQAAGNAVGIKFFMDSNSRPVTKSDVVLLGLQALVLEDTGLGA